MWPITCPAATAAPTADRGAGHQVAVDRLDAPGVLQPHTVAVAPAPPGFQHPPGPGGHNRRPGPVGNVDPVVKAAPARAKARGDPAPRRPDPARWRRWHVARDRHHRQLLGGKFQQIGVHPGPQRTVLNVNPVAVTRQQGPPAARRSTAPLVRIPCLARRAGWPAPPQPAPPAPVPRNARPSIPPTARNQAAGNSRCELGIKISLPAVKPPPASIRFGGKATIAS
jgi:hypothetical protein